MNVLSLCSGIGGLDLGLALAVPAARTICYVEIDPFCQAVLLARMADGLLDRAPIFGDLRQFDARGFRGTVDCVIGGFPCQPFSLAGKRRGIADPRHLWPDIARVLAECDPACCFFENVPGLLTTRTPDGRVAFQVVCDDLSALGYRVEAELFTAAEVGAPHRRQRLFILARRVADAGSVLGFALRQSSGECEAVGRKQHAPFVRDERVGDADRASKDARSPQSRPRHTASEPSGRVGDTERSRRETTRLRRNITTGSEPEAGRRSVGNTDNPRLEGRRESIGERADELPPWPPGPLERDQWASILARWPDLAPAVAITSGEQVGATRQSRTLAESVANAANRNARNTGSECHARRSAEGNAPQPPLRRVVDGSARRMDRLKALGNAVVPDVAALAWRTLSTAREED